MERLLELYNPWVVGKGENVSFGSDVTNLVFVDHLLLFHLLDGYDFVSLSISTDPDLSEGTPTNDLDWNEILDCQLLSLKSVVFGFLVQNFLLDKFLLLIREVHVIHLLDQLVPGFLPFTFFVLGLSVLVLDVGLGARSLFSSGRASRRL